MCFCIYEEGFFGVYKKKGIYLASENWLSN